ncbi:dienelactone hydrolase family protein [Photobacterium sp. SDRW27]|uniref:alpha/beta hydrolase family protein n=1 Tax=Photobacterium obscurum TaxID=2829490 RepID=UPI0022434C62|nr:dienelactone hydrolase family protein [Photobacterium obscurum]MCW8330138.1 dienelactone hydrolase family protein [Photobacterium obscurum]
MNRWFALGCTVIFASGSVCANNLGENVRIPIVEKGVLWDSNIELEATIYKPKGDGPFPTVIFNHGSTGPNVVPEEYTINPWGFGQYLVDKNIALIVPMRRGRGKSEGSYSELYSCNPDDITKGIAYAEKSLDATYSYLLKQPWVDSKKLVLSGNSRGGVLSLVYASHHPNSFAGVINFSGGWVGDVCNVGSQSQNVEIFEEAGRAVKAPALFIYGRNDSYYSDATIESLANAYKRGGGNVDFKFYQLGSSASGHDVFYKYWALWSSSVDDYLGKVLEK